MNISWELILGVCGGIVTVAAAAGQIIKIGTPFRKHIKRIEECEKKLEKDYNAITELKEIYNALARASLAQLDNTLTGDQSHDKIEEAKQNLQNILIKR